MIEDPAVRRRTMQAVRSKDTKPELTVRRIVTGLGYRYRLHRKDLPGKPDLAFVGLRKVVFVHGCFWHGHDCARGARVPENNNEYWVAKVGRNRARDVDHLKKLKADGWRAMVVWECDLKTPERVTKKLKGFLRVSERQRPSKKRSALAVRPTSSVQAHQG